MTKTILIVDDDDTIRELVAMALNDEGYETAVACHGAEALAWLRQRSADLILLDLRMPVMDGLQFARAYRESRGPHAPVIVLTAARNAAETAAEIGAVACVGKPFELDHLLAVVEANLNHRDPMG